MAASVICFLDNDILLKLSAFELLDEAIGVLNIRPEDFRVLDTARHVFRRNRKVSVKYSEIIRERAIEFVKTCQTVVPEVTDEFAVLNRLLDVGEATLVAATRDVSPFVLMTGDKRCLQVLATTAEISEVTARLQGRVVCLEQVMLLLIQRSSFEVVKQRVLLSWEVDTAIKACFGSGELAVEKHVIEALEGYIEALRQDAPGLLADMGQF
jgi:hypothetical protein